MKKNEGQGTVGPSIHGHGQNFGSDNVVTLTKGLINSYILEYPGGGRGVEEKINLKRIPISHSKSLVRGKNFMMGPIDKELLGEKSEIKKLERTTFEQLRIIKELEGELEVFKKETKEEERMGIFDVKAQRVEKKSNKAQAMELEAQMFEEERARARRIWRENGIKAELNEAEERDRGDEI